MIGKNCIGFFSHYHTTRVVPIHIQQLDVHVITSKNGMAYGLIYPYANPDVVFFGELDFLNQIYNSLVLLIFFWSFFVRFH